MNPEDNDNEIEPGAEATKTPDTNLDQEPDAEKLPEGEADETAEEGAVEAESNEETSPGDIPEEVPEEEEEDLEATVADLNDKLLRALAETENIRRRAVRDKEDASKYAISNFARDMLALSDNLHRAMDSVDPETRQKDAAVEHDDLLPDAVVLLLRLLRLLLLPAAVSGANAQASAAAQNDQGGRGHRVTVANLRSAKAEL